MDKELKQQEVSDEIGSDRQSETAMGEDHEDVKSTAVVKYSNLEMPALFHQLLPNTDLNEPPANWLHGASKLESYLRELSLGRERAFSSFKMAHRFPDQANEVDVISDGENIKKLLKIPYSKAHVSMIVHRVGTTLLLDDFDIHKYLLRQQQDDWSWLREFYQNVIVQNINSLDKDKIIVKKNKSRDHLQNRDMFSKFLYHSVLGEEEGDVDLDAAFPGYEHIKTRVEAVEGPHMPDPLNEPRLDQTAHQRTVLWTFEDLRMLIGTDLPIFGGEAHPCVSLRLRDMAKPINVLSGLDYWLDNLMCNVPELAMCYHINGIVQNYELMKTEDIPNIEDSKFSPNVVKDIAQNILSFLKSNATKEGHTYWLFKGHGDDVVKLYDLTSLTDDITSDEPSSGNPFMVPVGILLYRMARNMRQNSGRKKAGTIRTLLENCLLLLSHDTHPQVVTSAHYLLSDLYISDNIYNQELEPAGPESESDTDDDSTTHTNEGSESDTEDVATEDNASQQPQNAEQPQDAESAGPTEVEVKALCHPQSKKTTPSNVHPPITGTIQERCTQALSHIAEGLECLDKNVAKTGNPNQPSQKHKCDEQVTADPNIPIPLHFPHSDHHQSPNDLKLTDLDNHVGRASPNQVSVVTRLSTLPKGTWHGLSKTLLLRKAVIAYLAAGECNAARAQFGHALRHLKMALVCFCAMRHLTPQKEAENAHLLFAVLGLAGDVHLMLSHHYDRSTTYIQEFNDVTLYDTTIQASVDIDVPEFEFTWLSQITSNVEQNVKRSVLCYEVALDMATQQGAPPSPHVTSLKKRLGNVQNELGVQYMNLSAAKVNKEGVGHLSEKVQELWRLSYTCFVAGIAAFESLGDSVNAGLLQSNCGRLMRLCASAHAEYDDTGQQQEQRRRREMSTQEKHFFNKAAEQYQRALSFLKESDVPCVELTSSVTWELSSTYFTWATTLQDHAPLSTTSQEQVEKEVTELMTKALKYCDSDTDTPRQAMCQYRAATIHHRLGSLYHNAYRNQLNDQKKKHQRTLADLHYSRGSRYFSLVDSPCEVVRIQLEQVAMCEYQLNSQTSPTNKLKTLQASLSHILECREQLSFVHRQLTGPEEEERSELLRTYEVELNKLLPILTERLTFTLLNMVRCVSQNKKNKANDNNLVSYKTAYASVLKSTGNKLENAGLPTHCLHVYDMLQLVSQHCSPT